MCMRNRAGYGVRRIVRLGNLLDAQQHAHHHLNLMLVRTAIANHSLFDLHRRILIELICITLAGSQRHAARACNLNTCRDVF